MTSRAYIYLQGAFFTAGEESIADELAAKRPLGGFGCLDGVWIGFGAISHFVYSAGSRRLTWPEALTFECSYAYLAALLSPLVTRLADRFRFEPPNRKRNLAIHIAATVAFSVVTYFVWQLLMSVTGLRKWDMGGWESESRWLGAFPMEDRFIGLSF